MSWTNLSHMQYHANFLWNVPTGHAPFCVVSSFREAAIFVSVGCANPWKITSIQAPKTIIV